MLALAGCGTTGLSARGDGDDLRSHGSVYGDYLVASNAATTRDARVASARYLAVLARDPDNAAILSKAFVFAVAAGEMEMAGRLADSVSKADPLSDLSPLVKGVTALKQGSYAEAKGHFDSAHPPERLDLVTALALAWTAFGAGDVTSARALLSPTGDATSDVFISYHRARLEEAINNPTGADEAFAAADRATAGKSLTVALAYASWLQATGRSGDALKVLDTLIGTEPGNPVVLLARDHLRAGKPVGQRIRTAQQGAAEGFYGVASAVSSGDTGDAAIVYLRLALYLDPAHDGAAAFLGHALERVKRIDEAITAYRAVPEGSPYFVTSNVAAADLLYKSKREDEAIALLEKMERREDSSSLAASALGDVYRSAKRWNEAVAAYSRAISQAAQPLTRDDWILFFARGIALERSKRWSEAEADFRQALSLSPEQPEVMNYLAYTWIERHEHVDEALAMLQRAVDAQPTEGAIMDSLGWAYSRLGQYPKSAGILEKALALIPYDPTVNEHLGDAYWQVGRQREAKFMWYHALSLKPEPERLAIVKAKLEAGLAAGEALESAAQQ
jgi:tetratricopeptide (TPR) repeat protein